MDDSRPDKQNSISHFLKMRGISEPSHPLIAVVDYAKTPRVINEFNAEPIAGFYRIAYRPGFKGKVKYGLGHYVYKEGGLVFAAPNQVIIPAVGESKNEGYVLMFHPDFIRNYPLGQTIHKYQFFSYQVSEALVLTSEEKVWVTSIFDFLLKELNNTEQPFNQDILVNIIELMLNYSNRFYKRQFEKARSFSHDLVTQLEGIIHAYLTKEEGYTTLPSILDIAQKLNISTRNLNDIISAITGLTTQQYVHRLLLEEAKNLLINTRLSVKEIAYKLGFEHSQSFSKLFKQKTDQTPGEFRKSFFQSNEP